MRKPVNNFVEKGITYNVYDVGKDVCHDPVDFKKIKEKLLKWVSGNYQVGTGTNSPQFTTPLSRTNNFATLFSSQFSFLTNEQNDS